MIHLLESNPDLSPKACYDIANSAIMHVVESLGSSEIWLLRQTYSQQAKMDKILKIH